MAGDDERARALVRRAAAADEDLALGVLAGADTALISYSVSVGCQPRTGWSASSTAPNRALTGPLPVASADALLAADRRA